MKFKPISSPLRTAFIYLIFGGLWILTSDTVLGLFIHHTSNLYPLAQTLKGWLFVLVGAVLLYSILSVDMKALHKREEEIRQSHNLYQQLFDSNPQPMWVYDLDTLRFLMVNHAALEHYGYTETEFLSMTIKDIRPPEQLAALTANLAQPPQPVERSVGWVHRKKDGSVIDVEISSHAIDFKGRPARMVLANDVTERKKIESALQTSEAQFRNLVERMPAITYISSIDDLSTTQYISPQIEQVLGFLPKEFESDPHVWGQQIHPEDRDATLKIIHECQQKREAFACEYRMISKDGRVVWFRDESNLIKDEAGKPIFYEGFMLDITEQKQAEMALQASELRFRALFDEVPIAIWEEDFSEAKRQIDRLKAQGVNDFRAYFAEHPEAVTEYSQSMKVLDVNRSALKLFKAQSKEELINSTYAQASQGELDHNHEDLLAIAEGKLGNQWDGMDETLTGEPLQISLSWSVVPGYEKSYARVIVTTMDITERKQAEEALRVSEENYRGLVESSDNAIAVFDRDGNVLYANQASQQLWKSPELVGKTLYDLFQKEFADHHLISMKKVIDEQIIDTNELEVVIHGTKMWFHVTMSPLKNLDGSVDRLLLSAIDLTQRKRAEEAQRQSEILFFKIFRASSIGIHLFRLADGRSYNVNDAFLEIIGYPREELIGRTAAELNLFQNVETQKEWMQALREGRSVRNQDAKVRRKSGEIRDCLASLDLIDVSGEVMVLVVATDITERRKAEEQLRGSEERFRLMAENIEEGFWITNPNSNEEIYLSPAVERIFGRSINDLMARSSSFIESILPEDVPLVLTNMERQKLGNATNMEYRIKRPDGRIRWVWDRAFPILNPNGTVRLVTGITTDITERKATDAKIQTQIKRLSALNSIDRAISSSMRMDVALDVLLIEVVAQLNVDAASILLLNETDQTLDFAAGKGFNTSIEHASVPLGFELAGKVGTERKVIHVPNLSEFQKGVKRNELIQEEHFLEYFGVPLIVKGQLKGVLEIFNREALNPDPEWLTYLETLGGQAAIAIESAQLFEGLQRSNQELFMAYDATIAGWSHAMDLRDKETEGHTQRVTEITVRLAERMGISQQELVHIRRGALLHDIGKLGVPDHILLKPDKLTDEEWHIMRMHPVYARDMLTPIHYLRPSLDIPYCHHEKWDGTGYPRGLKGEDIPLAARLFAIIDVWDALRSDRPYRAGWSAEKTRDYIQSESGKHFDPVVVEYFLSLLEELSES